MLQKINCLLLVVFLGLCFNSTTYASYSPGMKEFGLYIGADIGYGKIKEQVAESSKEHKHELAGSAFVGYRFSRRWAIEVGIPKFPKQDFNITTNKNNYAAYGVAKLMMPLSDHIIMFAKGGGAKIRYTPELAEGQTIANSDIHEEYTFYYGGGISYVLVPSLEIHVQFATTNKRNNIPVMQLLAAGLTYVF